MILALLVLLVAGLRVALPTLVERGAAYGSRYWLGLPVRIDNADFDLLEGVVVLEGLSVGAVPDDVAPMDAALEPPPVDVAAALLHFDRVFVHLSWKDLRDGALHLPELVLDAPTIRLLRESDGAIDPLRHARPLAPPSEELQEEEEASDPWPVAVDRFSFTSPNVAIVDAGGAGELLAFSLEKFELDAIAVHGGNISLGGVGVEGPVLRVQRDLVLAAPATTPPPPPAPPVLPPAPPVVAPAPPPGGAPAPAAAPPGYRIEKIDIARATFTWVTDEGPLDVALRLKASDITADEGKRFPVEVNLEIGGGSLALAGDVGILPPAYTGRIRWNGLPFPPLLLASLPDLAEWLRSADSTGDLNIDLDIAGARGAPAVHMSGQATIDTLAITDPGEKEVAVGWKQLEVKMKEVLVPLPQEGKPARTTVASLELLRLTEPRIRYTHPSASLRALLGIPAPEATAEPAAVAAAGTKGQAKGDVRVEGKVVAKPATKAEAAEGRTAEPAAEGGEAAASPIDLTISLLELVAGDMEVLDTTVTPPVTSFLHELAFSARDVHIPDPSASQIRLHAIVPKASILDVEGSLKPGNVGDFTIKLQKLDLPVFSPYAAAGGASLDAGEASVTTRLKLRGARMEVENDLVLRKFGVSLRDPDSFSRNFGMPIDLALALLRDPSGDIRLKIPVKFDEKGAAEVSMGTVIASALKAALLGAVTAPLKMLGAAFGGGGEGEGGLAIAPVGALPGAADLVADATARIDGLAKLLQERPSMGLSLRGRTGNADAPLVAEQILIERLKAGDGLPDLEDSGFLARRRIGQALLARDKAATKKAEVPTLSAEDQALYDRYLAAVEIPAARLDALAAARAEQVRDQLQARKVDPGRVAIGEREAAGDPGVVLSFRAI
ncbi:MAG: DUF748 domain-containing protein [Candidatus Binatia bacterium]